MKLSWYSTQTRSSKHRFYAQSFEKSGRFWIGSNGIAWFVSKTKVFSYHMRALRLPVEKGHHGLKIPIEVDNLAFSLNDHGDLGQLVPIPTGFSAYVSRSQFSSMPRWHHRLRNPYVVLIQHILNPNS